MIVRLTEREVQVTQRLICGFTDKEISEVLKISEHTVSGHLRRIFAKLGVHNRAGAVGQFLQATGSHVRVSGARPGIGV